MKPWQKNSVWAFVFITSIFLLRFVIHEGLRKNNFGIFKKYSVMFLEKNNFNTLVIGSSRAAGHFNPRIIDSVLGFNTFNIGVEGSNNLLTYGVLKSYLYNSSLPKTIIMNIDYHFAHHSSDTVFNFPRFFPYLDNPVLYNVLKGKKQEFFFYKYFPMTSLAYMGDKFLNSSIRGYLQYKSPYDAEYYQGNQKVISLEHKDFNLLDSSKYLATILPENLQYLDSTILLCQKNNIQLYFVISPCYIQGTRRITNAEDQINAFKLFAKQRDIPMFDYSYHEISYQKDLFADYYHMKGIGCDRFSRVFSNDLNTYISQNK